MSDLRMSSTLTGENGIRISRGEVYSFPVHSHSYFELMLYHPFEGHVQVNDSNLQAKAPFAVLMTPSDLHSTHVTGGASPFIKIAFSRDQAGEYLVGRLTAPRLLSHVSTDTLASALFIKMTEEHPHEEQVILLRALLLEITRQGKVLSAAPVSGGGALIARAVAIIGDEFQSELTLQQLAKRLNISYQHLSALFSEQLGMTFSAYLTDIRLRHAAALLTGSTLSATEICYACGYRNLSHFLRSFKKRYGVTPKQYRARP